MQSSITEKEQKKINRRTNYNLEKDIMAVINQLVDAVGFKKTALTAIAQLFETIAPVFLLEVRWFGWIIR